MIPGDKGYVQAIVDQSVYNLTFAQQDFIKKNCEKMRLMELMREVYQEEGLNEKSLEFDHAITTSNTIQETHKFLLQKPLNIHNKLVFLSA